MATHQSPDGYDVDIVEGDGDGVYDRGTAIVNLGRAMDDAVEIMTNLVHNGADMRGSWITKLRESAEEVYGELGEAADLYGDVGPHIQSYGVTLSSVIRHQTTTVPEANDRWTAYQNAIQQAQEERATAEEPPTSPFDAEDLPEYAAWKESGDDFDSQRANWRAAYDSAVRGVRSGNDAGIKDSWQDNLAGAFDVALKILAVAGVVLAVLGLIIGGPIVGLLAIAVAVVTLALTAFNFAYGYASGWDLAFAIIGVIPFGSFGDFAANGFKAGMKSWAGFSDGLGLVDDATRWAWSARLSNGPREFISEMRNLAPDGNMIRSTTQFLSGQTDEMWDLIGGAAYTGEQILYALGSVGTHYNNLYLLGYSGWTAGEGVVELIS